MFKHIEFEENKRIIVISDIHGDLDSFKELLVKCNYDENEDYLIVLGDLIEKGNKNLETLHHMMNIANLDKVFILKGNCDRVLENVMDNERNIPETLKYLSYQKLSVFHEMAENVGTSIETNEDLKYVLAYLKEEKNFIDTLPTALISKDFAFVHAGIRDLENENDEKFHLTARNFFNSNVELDRYLVVGHFPVCNYSERIINNNPRIDLEKKIISIDGGNCVKNHGQLNALIIEKVNDAYSFTYRTQMNKERRLFKPYQQGNEDSCKLVKWPNLEVSILEQYDDTSLVLTSQNEEIEVRNEFLRQDKGKWFFISDYSDYHFTLTRPKLGYVVYENEEEVLASIDGKIGWIRK